MNDSTADKYVDAYLTPDFGQHDKEFQRRQLRLMVKEVERDTRHKAAMLASQLTSAIHNLNHDAE